MSSRDPLAKAITHLTSHTGDPARCPSLEVLTDWAEGLLSPAERVFVLDHITSCPLCAPIAADLVVVCKSVRDLHRGWGGWRGPLLCRLGRLRRDRLLSHAYRGHLARCDRCRRRAGAGDLSWAAAAPRAAAPVCPHCQAPGREGARFCGRCGKALREGDEARRGGTARAELVIAAGSGAVAGRAFPLHARRQTIGRGRRADINLGGGDPGVSRRHACILWEGGAFTIRDLGSAAGTHVNGRRVERQALRDGDAVTIGGSKLVFRLRRQ